MKVFRLTAIFVAFLPAIIFWGCDDAGFISAVPKGLVTFSVKNLKPLDPNVDGVYELWMRFDSAGSITNYSFGRFNFNSGGALVDTLGNPMNITYSGDTNKLYQVTDAFITVEPPGDYNNEPSNAVLLSGSMNFNEDSMYTDLKMNGSMALGNTGLVLATSPPGGYIINTHTGTSSTCLRGVWLCDTNGYTYFPQGMQLSAPGWVYQTWLKDKTNPNNPIYYSMGRFRDPFAEDFNGAGPCAGTGPHYSRPGEDWVQSNCPPGMPQVQNINNGNYEILLTLEPSNEQPGSAAFNSPFPLRLFIQEFIVVVCKRRDNLFCQGAFFPMGKIKLTYRE